MTSLRTGTDLSVPANPESAILDPGYGYSVTESYVSVFRPDIHGYTISLPDPSLSLDDDLIGPNSMDSLGALSELPGVGWRDKNRLLLSYAAGDTVGEASRWFHTYTYVNL